jgi:hypothetical protein
MSLSFRFRKFQSGLKVMQAAEYSDDTVLASILDVLAHHSKVSAVGLAKISGVSVMVAREQLMVS